MSSSSLPADDIARFLENHPRFFLEHEYLLQHLQLPHPRSDKVISLSERQTLYLRKHNQQLEKQISQFLHAARENELISRALLNWACDLLAFKGDKHEICTYICQRLQQQYGLQNVQLRLWWDQHPFQVADCSLSAKQWIQNLAEPYTGPTTDKEIATWFDAPMASMAVIPLYLRHDQQCIGALALGSDISKRFTYNIGTDFLVAMGKVLMATLARYHEQQPQTA